MYGAPPQIKRKHEVKRIYPPLFGPYPRSAPFRKTSLKDDLTVIEGIGPNIQRLFFQNNINSWESLSKCSVQKCQSILDAAGEAYKMHSPKGWPDQARMAHRGQWERLRKWKNRRSLRQTLVNHFVAFNSLSSAGT